MKKILITGGAGFIASNLIKLILDNNSSTNKLTFSLAIGAANAATNANDVLSFGANPLAHAGGSTIVDKSEGGNATITSSASIGTAAGTITVTA